MIYDKYDIYHSIESKNGKRKWDGIKTGYVLLEADKSCIAGAEAKAIKNGVATLDEFHTPLNSRYFIFGKFRAAKSVYVGKIEL